MDSTTTQNEILEFLRDEGYRPRIDDDGDIVFKHEGKTHLILLDEKDEFFQLALPNIWRVESPQERRDAIEASERATAKTKVGKVYLVRENVWAGFETLCSVEAFKAVLPRALSVVRAASRNFAEHMALSRAASGRIATA